jgi:short-subunit dehydrogenase
MADYKDRYALITGASSGIGYELAKLFAKDGKNLIIVSRNRDKLDHVKIEIENKFRETGALPICTIVESQTQHMRL